MKSPFENKMGTVFVQVKDLEKAVRWYCELFGLKFKEGDYSNPIYSLDGCTDLDGNILMVCQKNR